METLIREMPSVAKELPLLAVRLKSLRERLGMSQQDLAVKAGLSVSMVSQIEQGKKPDPRLSTIQALARALDLDCTTLVEGGGNGRKPRRSAKK
jgi:transcriptional regulator with XRE-family HTH domain